MSLYMALVVFIAFVSLLVPEAACTKSSKTHRRARTAATGPETVHPFAPRSYLLLPRVSHGAAPTTRYYRLDVRRSTFAPDGFTREGFTINGQMPGPVIEAVEGDTLHITVLNNLESGATTSMHWHGIRQNGTQTMDGVPGFSQCPIAAGQSQTYTFDTVGQSGTFWYHSHTSSQYTDGLLGPLIIHPRHSVSTSPLRVDADVVVLIQDWYHDRAQTISTALRSSKGYHGSPVAPAPQSGLINGRGVFDCNKLGGPLGSHQDQCQTPAPPSMVVPRGRVRFRFINGGSHASQIVSIDTKMLSVVAADGTLIQPRRVHRLPFANGQRYDAVVDFSNATTGEAMWLRSEIDQRCFAVQEPTLDPVLRMAMYVQHDTEKRPDSIAWPDAVPKCQDLDETTMLLSATPATIPEVAQPKHVFIFDSVLGQLTINGSSSKADTVNRYKFNGTTYVEHDYQPFLRTLSQNKTLPRSDVAVVTVPDDAWTVDIIINNRDVAITHPYHLHGMEFAIVGRGQGALSLRQYSSTMKSQKISLNLVNPLRRDTLTIPANSHAILRLDASIKGVWPLHCHIAWHLSMGFMAAVVIHPGAIASTRSIWTAEAQRQCEAGIAAGASDDEARPPRKRRAPINRNALRRDVRQRL